jgi:ABC-type oligopeptide transport system ATPase subunit
MAFRKAVKRNARARVALIGPAGSGKSLTGLILARALAGPAGTIAAVDTESESLSKYSDEHNFDVDELTSYSPQSFIDALTVAEKARYDVFMCDSFSHFWMGKDGTLEFVDSATARNKAKGNYDGMSGWKDFSPVEREMFARIRSSPCHIILTMRTKTDYEEVTDEKTGKKKRVKIGLAPVQRAGLEYELDLVGYMTDENEFITDKTRCKAFSKQVIREPQAKDFAPFIQWLAGSMLPEAELTDHLGAIATASDELGLRRAYETAWNSASKFHDDAALTRITAAKDTRKAALGLA